MNAHIESHDLSPELLLAVFDMPVSFHRCLVPVAGGVTAALMLSQAIWITETLENAPGGWFMCSQAQWTQETGLTRWEQETARRALRRAGPRAVFTGDDAPRHSQRRITPTAAELRLLREVSLGIDAQPVPAEPDAGQLL